MINQESPGGTEVRSICLLVFGVKEKKKKRKQIMKIERKRKEKEKEKEKDNRNSEVVTGT